MSIIYSFFFFKITSKNKLKLTLKINYTNIVSTKLNCLILFYLILLNINSYTIYAKYASDLFVYEYWTLLIFIFFFLIYLILIVAKYNIKFYMNVLLLHFILLTTIIFLSSNLLYILIIIELLSYYFLIILVLDKKIYPKFTKALTSYLILNFFFSIVLYASVNFFITFVVYTNLYYAGYALNNSNAFYFSWYFLYAFILVIFLKIGIFPIFFFKVYVYKLIDLRTLIFYSSIFFLLFFILALKMMYIWDLSFHFFGIIGLILMLLYMRLASLQNKEILLVSTLSIIVYILLLM